ncbi:MAG: asparagine synthase C-terminal domain-containing protein [Gemmatimonadota bacterium]
MRAIVAAAGIAAGASNCFANAARADREFIEHTSADGTVRLGTSGAAGTILQWAVRDGYSAAVLGSGLLALGDDAAGRILGNFLRRGTPGLDDIPDDAAVVIAQPSTGQLISAAGVGNHRLFAWQRDGSVLLATHLGLLATALGAELRLDRSYEDFLLGFGFLPDGRTPYELVRALPGGKLYEWPGGTSRPLGPKSIELQETGAGQTALKQALHDTLIETLAEQAGGRRRHAVLLGGFDSALVAAGLRRLGHDVDCYTFSFGDTRYEQRNAGALADHIGAKFTRVELTADVIGNALSRYSDVLSQPGAQPHYLLHTVHASRVIAADGHNSVFTGDGCDAIFLGYPTVSRRARVVTRLGRMPVKVRHALLAAAATQRAEHSLGHVARMARSALRSAALPWPASGHLPTQYLDEIALQRLRRGAPPARIESIRDTRLRLAAGLEQLDPVRLAFHGNGLTGQSRAKVEGSVADSGIAQFSPFLHARMRSLATSLPVGVLRPPGGAAGDAGKAVLIDMVRERGLLPETIIAMPKQSPSDSPIDTWYAGPLRPLVFSLLDRLPFDYDRSYIEEILAPKRAENVYRNRVSLGHHAFQAIGLLCSYASFTGRAK